MFVIINLFLIYLDMLLIYLFIIYFFPKKNKIAGKINY